MKDVTELIPKAPGNYWLIFFFGAVVVAVLEFAYGRLPALSESFGEACLTPLDVASSGSILAWCLSTLFLLTASVSLLNSRLGKKYDDPDKGDIWFWTTFAAILLSLDMQVRFHETLSALLVYAAGTPLYRDGAVWWLAIYFFVFGLISVRLFQNMWAYPPACLLFSLAILGAVASQLMKIGAISVSETPEAVVTVWTSVEAIAVLLLFLSFLLFGRRQVLRDPQVALLWFANVWNHAMPAKKPTAAPVVIPPAPSISASSPPPQLRVEATTKSGQMDRPVPERPTLEKDDDFLLLKAS